MKKISIWARQHKWHARMLLVFCLLLVNITGIIIGLLLKDLNIKIPVLSFSCITLLYFLGVVFYPKKSLKNQMGKDSFYRKQKNCDIILAVAAFFMAICISNDDTPFKTYFGGIQSVFASTPAKYNSVRPPRTIAEFSKSMRDENGKMLKWYERKKLLKEQIKAIKKSNEISNAGKVGLIILSVLAAVGLLYLVGSLACSLSCNGSEGAAILVAVGGSTLIIILLIAAIRAIIGKKRKKKKKEELITPSEVPIKL